MTATSAPAFDVDASSVGSLGVARTGSVVSFDDEAGQGVVEDGANRRFPFHCTTIAGGTRTIAVDTPVEFVVQAGLAGRFEARSVTPR